MTKLKHKDNFKKNFFEMDLGSNSRWLGINVRCQWILIASACWGCWRGESGIQCLRDHIPHENFASPAIEIHYVQIIHSIFSSAALTFAINCHISSSDNLRPMHIRVPNPNGSEVYGWWWLSIGCPLIQRSGINSRGRGKNSSISPMSWCDTTTKVFRLNYKNINASS